MKKLVLTGAAGRLGSHLREPLSKLADTLVSSDLVNDIGTLYDGEQYVKADLSKLDEIVPYLLPVGDMSMIADEPAADVTIEMANEKDSEESDGDDDKHTADEEDAQDSYSDEDDMASESD